MKELILLLLLTFGDFQTIKIQDYKLSSTKPPPEPQYTLLWQFPFPYSQTEAQIISDPHSPLIITMVRDNGTTVLQAHSLLEEKYISTRLTIGKSFQKLATSRDDLSCFALKNSQQIKFIHFDKTANLLKEVYNTSVQTFAFFSNFTNSANDINQFQLSSKCRFVFFNQTIFTINASNLTPIQLPKKEPIKALTSDFTFLIIGTSLYHFDYSLFQYIKDFSPASHYYLQNNDKNVFLFSKDYKDNKITMELQLSSCFPYTTMKQLKAQSMKEPQIWISAEMNLIQISYVDGGDKLAVWHNNGLNVSELEVGNRAWVDALKTNYRLKRSSESFFQIIDYNPVAQRMSNILLYSFEVFASYLLLFRVDTIELLEYTTQVAAWITNSPSLITYRLFLSQQSYSLYKYSYGDIVSTLSPRPSPLIHLPVSSNNNAIKIADTGSESINNTTSNIATPNSLEWSRVTQGILYIYRYSTEVVGNYTVQQVKLPNTKYVLKSTSIYCKVVQQDMNALVYKFNGKEYLLYATFTIPKQSTCQISPDCSLIFTDKRIYIINNTNNTNSDNTLNKDANVSQIYTYVLNDYMPQIVSSDLYWSISKRQIFVFDAVNKQFINTNATVSSNAQKIMGKSSQPHGVIVYGCSNSNSIYQLTLTAYAFANNSISMNAFSTNNYTSQISCPTVTVSLQLKQALIYSTQLYGLTFDFSLLTAKPVLFNHEINQVIPYTKIVLGESILLLKHNDTVYNGSDLKQSVGGVLNFAIYEYNTTGCVLQQVTINTATPSLPYVRTLISEVDEHVFYFVESAEVGVVEVHNFTYERLRTPLAESGEGVIVVDNYILPCSSHCRSCLSPSLCLQCYPGAELQSKECLPCADRCSSCLVSRPTQCTACSKGAYLIQNKCQLCSELCQGCAGSATNCIECSMGYYLANDSLCRPCEDSKCVSCQQKEQCMVCANGYVVSSAGKCTPCVVGCNFCSQLNVTECLFCGRYFRLQNGICIPCAQNCASCNGNECQQCKTGYQLVSAGQKVCSPKCQYPCSTCLSSSFCTSCFNGSTLVNNFCLIDSSCNSTHSCLACNLQQTLSQGICLQCTLTDPACLRCLVSNLSQCVECAYGYYSRNNVCTACKCNDCIDELACSECPKGWLFLKEIRFAKCVPCTQPCLTCYYAPNYCIKCRQNYTQVGSICYLNSTSIIVNISFTIFHTLESTIGKIAQLAGIPTDQISVVNLTLGLIALDALIITQHYQQVADKLIKGFAQPSFQTQIGFLLAFVQVGKQLPIAINITQNIASQAKNNTSQTQNIIPQIQNNISQIKNNTSQIKNNTLQVKNNTSQTKNITSQNKNVPLQAKNNTSQNKNNTSQVKNNTVQTKNNTSQTKNSTSQIQNINLQTQNNTFVNISLSNISNIQNAKNNVQNNIAPHNKTLNDTLQHNNSSFVDKKNVTQNNKQVFVNISKDVVGLNQSIRNSTENNINLNNTKPQNNFSIENKTQISDKDFLKEIKNNTNLMNKTSNQQDNTVQENLTSIDIIKDKNDTQKDKINMNVTKDNNKSNNQEQDKSERQKQNNVVLTTKNVTQVSAPVEQGGLNTGSIIAIVLSSIAVLGIVIAVIVWKFFSKKQDIQDKNTQFQSDKQSQISPGQTQKQFYENFSDRRSILIPPDAKI